MNGCLDCFTQSAVSKIRRRTSFPFMLGFPSTNRVREGRANDVVVVRNRHRNRFVSVFMKSVRRELHNSTLTLSCSRSVSRSGARSEPGAEDMRAATLGLGRSQELYRRYRFQHAGSWLGLPESFPPPGGCVYHSLEW